MVIINYKTFMFSSMVFIIGGTPIEKPDKSEISD